MLEAAPTASSRRQPDCSSSRRAWRRSPTAARTSAPPSLPAAQTSSPIPPRAAPRLPHGREREILQLVAESHSTKEIAAKLGISVKTVDNHRTNLMRKLNLHDVASLTRYALEVGLIEPKKTV